MAPRDEGRGAFLCPEARFFGATRLACILFRTSYSWGLDYTLCPGPYLRPAGLRVQAISPFKLSELLGFFLWNVYQTLRKGRGVYAYQVAQ